MTIMFILFVLCVLVIVGVSVMTYVYIRKQSKKPSETDIHDKDLED